MKSFKKLDYCVYFNDCSICPHNHSYDTDAEFHCTLDLMTYAMKERGKE